MSDMHQKTKILEPEDPNDTGPGLSNSELKRAESTAAAPAPQEDPQKSPKPVSVEEVLDEGLSAAQPVEVEDTVKSGGGAVDPVEPSTEHIEDVKMTDASQDGTANPAAPSSKQTEGADPADALQAETTITQKSPLSEPLAGDKRKAEQVNSANGGTAQDGFRSDEPTEKKRKSNDLATNGAAKKVGRPKKEQKKAPVPGKTARRTRSQGAPNQI
ncbi:hypothetical protein BJ170DRAFT_684777 [Xylariales sp. AK1849]|nr:hypothetical protein BJ170DRAFT_684777 [Xylariales sp. AK1849]